MRLAAVAALASLAIALAGCGSADVGSGPASSAGVLKAGALVYWQTVSDPDSSQWQQAEDLIKRFPDGSTWLAELRRQVEAEGITWAGDVRPALGSVVDVAVYARSGSDQPSAVGLTNSKDKGKMRALVDKLNSKSDQDVVLRMVGDWVAISDSEASLDAALKGLSGKSLSDDAGFKSAMKDLPEDALTRGYVDPARAVELAGAGMDARVFSTLGLDKLDFAGGWAKAKDSGAELAVALHGDAAERLLGTGDPYSSKLLDKVPANAFAFYSFRGDGVKRQLQQLQSSPLFSLGLRQFEAESGIKVDEVAALLEGEVALYARPDAPIPEITLLLDSNDAAAGKASVERILRLAAARLGGRVTQDGDVTTATFQGFSVSVGSLDGTIVVSTSRNAIADLQDSGQKLADSDRYKDALKAADAPDQYTGLLYVDLNKATDLILDYMGVSGENVPGEVSRNLKPLHSLVAYGKQDGSLSTSLAFIEID